MFGGKDNGKGYLKKANLLIENHPKKTKQYINRAIDLMNNIITNPGTSKDFLNRFINANIFCARTIKELANQFKLNIETDYEIKTIHNIIGMLYRKNISRLETKILLRHQRKLHLTLTKKFDRIQSCLKFN